MRPHAARRLLPAVHRLQLLQQQQCIVGRMSMLTLTAPQWLSNRRNSSSSALGVVHHHHHHHHHHGSMRLYSSSVPSSSTIDESAAAVQNTSLDSFNDDDDGMKQQEEKEEESESVRFERDLRILVGDNFAADERVRSLARHVQSAYDAYVANDFMKSRRVFDETTAALEQILLYGEDTPMPPPAQEADAHPEMVGKRRSYPLLGFCYNNLAEAMKSLMKYVDLTQVDGSSNVDPADGYKFRYSLDDVSLLFDRALDVWGYDRKRHRERNSASEWTEQEQIIFLREMGALYNNIGLYHMEETGMVDTAMQWFQRAEEKRQKLIELYPEEIEFKTQLGITLNNIAQCHSRMRNHQKAMSSYIRAGEIFHEAVEHSIDNYSPVYIVVLNNIGLGYFNRQQTSEAMEHFNKALDLIQKREKATGVPAGEELGITLSNIASADMQRHMYAEAENFYRQALANFRKNLNPNHPNIAECCSQLAAAIFQRRKNGGNDDPAKAAAENEELRYLAGEAKRIAEFHKQRREALQRRSSKKGSADGKSKPRSRFSQMFKRRR